MFELDILEDHLKFSHTIKNNQAIWAEWNLNQSYNISKVGNYRYRPSSDDLKYNTLISFYDPTDAEYYYTNATDSDIIINAGFDNLDEQVYLTTPKRKINLLYSLDDCFKQHRPRSGINKMLYLGISSQGTGYTQYIDSLYTFRTIAEYSITNASYAQGADGKTYITYESDHRLVTGDFVKVRDITVNGSARITISSGATSGTYDNVNYDSIYVGQYVVGSSFPSGTYITSISSTGSGISFSNAANQNLSGVVLSFTGTNTSEFNITNATKVVSTTPTTFTIQSNITRPINYTSGGIVSLGYSGTTNFARRPRYYMASRYDDFKYWTSYRTEVSNGKTNEYGISISNNTGGSNPSYYIYDAAPFVIYNDPVPANRIVVKMQTNVGDINYGPYRMSPTLSIQDPLYGEQNMTTPKRWAVQILDSDNKWIFAKSFSENDTRSDGSPIIGPDGYVELEYGLVIPDAEIWGDFFTLVDVIPSISARPSVAPFGYAYLLKESETERGTLFISDGAAWQNYTPHYEWQLLDKDVTRNTKVVTKLVNPDLFVEGDKTTFREFNFIYGMRIVVDTMNKINSTFDLIEFSPRLVSDISKMVTSFSVNKVMSDLANHSMPTGNLLASNGKISIFDEEFAFNENNSFDESTNTGSIISNYIDSRIKFIFYDIVKNIGGIDYYIPIKHLYSERAPQASGTVSLIDFDLRDYFFLLESKKAPEMLLTNVSLSYAISVLLDNIGFSNYTFKRISGEDELIIPYFFVSVDQNVAEVLQELAVASQSAIFFDEFNNLVVMSKNYIMPIEDQRKTDLVLYGQEETVDGGTALPNIINVSSEEKKVYNDGEINYTTRYIQRSIGSISQAPYVEEYKTYIYKPVLLWEVAGQENVRSKNEAVQESQGYALAAMPLKTSLTADIPVWDSVKQELKNNIIDFGESIYWLMNHTGYFYSNGEIIKYDAVEYSVAGVASSVWITNNQEYQNYFSRLKFNGKMYPTGRVRIYTKLDGTNILEHGRGQFGTAITNHEAGIDSESPWIKNITGFVQNSKDYLFNTNPKITYPTTGTDAAGTKVVTGGQTVESNQYSLKSTREGIIKNFMANPYETENTEAYNKSTLSGSIQTSALIFNGPELPSDIRSSDYVTYVYKEMRDKDGNPQPFTHFGTRMRIIGKINASGTSDQTPVGAYPLYSSSELTSSDPTKQVSIESGSGGLAFNLNTDKNIGYYYEIAALTQDNVSSFKNNSNIVSYEIATSPVTQALNNVVTVTLKTQHDFEVGDRIVISGLIDDNRKTSPTLLNGEYEITSISQDRKQFRYSVPTAGSASITSVSKSGSGTAWTITYTTSAAHSYRIGSLVTVSNLAPAGYNLTVATPVTAVTDTTFSVSVSSDPGTLSDGIGDAAGVALSTTCSTGGTASKIMESETIISDVFFYKVVSGYNSADIIKKEYISSTSTATLTTLREHDFSIGEEITVSGVDSFFNGTVTVTAIGSDRKTFSYIKSGGTQTSPAVDLSTLGKAQSTNVIAIPVILWRGLTEIIVDDGTFASQQRLSANDKSTVYDLSVEYLNIGSSRKFYLYLNDKQIATVTDLEPLKEYENIGLFVRGSSRVMFENVYALADNFGENQSKSLQLPISRVFSEDILSQSEAINKYAISGLVQSTYLSGISSESNPKYSIFYEEFGTIMREAAYFKINYDKAYPALYATLAETANRVKAYTVSGFFAGSYGAEFMIFNAVDKTIALDDTSGNHLRILGIAFTQNTTNSLRVDDFFKKNSNFVNSLYSGQQINAQEYLQTYNEIESSRNKYGKNSFIIESPFIQTDAAAEAAMDWIIRRTMRPKKTMGVQGFGLQNIQLGDIVSINYNENDVDVVSSSNVRYVVYSIEYSRQAGSDISQKIYLAEV